MDVGTGLAVLGSTQIVAKLLGPTAEYLGEELQRWTQRRTENLKRIISISVRRLGNGIETEGGIPPRVFNAVVHEGAFCEDAITAEYLGGVLASSRSEVSRDDRAVCFTRLIGRLSTYQLRTHYILYHTLKSLFDGEKIHPGTTEGRYAMETYIPESVYVDAMSFDQRENATVLLDHAMHGLTSEALIDPHTYAWGPAEHTSNLFQSAGAGIVFHPWPLEIELFLAAYGTLDLDILEFLNPKVRFELEQSVVIQSGAQRTRPEKESAVESELEQ